MMDDTTTEPTAAPETTTADSPAMDAAPPMPMYADDDAPEIDHQHDAEPADDGVEQAAPAAEPDAEPQQPHNFDKGLQKLQQKQAATDAQLTRMTELLEQIATNGGQQQQQPEAEPAADPSAAPEGEPASDPFADLDLGDDDDLATMAELRRVMQAMQGMQAGNSSIAEMQQQLQALQAAQQEQQDRKAADQYWAEFQAANGFDGREQWTTTYADVVEKYPTASQDQIDAVARHEFERWKAEQVAQGSTAPEPAAVSPASSQPPRTTKGTQTVKSGASTTQSATRGTKPRPRMYVPDDDI